MLSRNRARISIACLLAGHLAAIAPVVQAQAAAVQADAASASTQARLKRLGTEIFSGPGRLPEAIRELKEILAIDPRSAEAHLLLGIAYRTQGSPEMVGESVAEFRQAIELNPSLAPARLYLAYVYIDLGRLERAREELRAALAQVPGNVQFLTLLGEVERLLKNLNRSVDVLEQALKTDPSAAQARYYLGLTLFDLGKRDEAIKQLEAVVQSGAKVADAYIALGIAYLEAGRVDEGLEILSQATHLDPARPDTRLQLARAYRLKGALQKADEQLALARPQGAALASPTAQDRQVEFDFYLELGLLRLQEGRLDAAAEAFQRVLDMDPTHAPTLRHMADVKRRQQEKRPKKEAGGWM